MFSVEACIVIGSLLIVRRRRAIRGHAWQTFAGRRPFIQCTDEFLPVILP
jgi:hypothetical protein